MYLTNYLLSTKATNEQILHLKNIIHNEFTIYEYLMHNLRILDAQLTNTSCTIYEYFMHNIRILHAQYTNTSCTTYEYFMHNIRILDAQLTNT